MTNEVKNVPELRFPGFEGEWEINLFGELVNNKSEKYLPSINEGLIDIELDSIESNTGRLINKYDSREFSSQKHKFEKNQVLYSKLRPYLNKFYYTKFNGVCSSEIWVLNTKDELKIMNKFIYNFIQTNKFSIVANKSAGSKMPRADWNLVENIRLNNPSLDEQQKIGDFFSKLDRQIELEEQKLEKLEKQKKGYMQKIFSQQLRFKDENGDNYPDWEEEKLGDLYDKGKAGGTPKSTVAKYYNGDIPFLSISDITEQGKFIVKTEKKLTESGLQNSTAWLVPKYSINYAMYASVGYLSINKITLATSQAIFNMTFNDHKIVEYIYYYLNYIREINILEKLVGTGTQSNLSASTMKKMIVTLPCKKELEKVVGILVQLDNSINLQIRKIESLNNRKNGFLQKMFV